MASSYDISSGTGRVELSNIDGTYVGIQLITDSLDSAISIKLQHSSDGVNFEDLSDTTKSLAIGGSDFVETDNFCA